MSILSLNRGRVRSTVGTISLAAMFVLGALSAQAAPLTAAVQIISRPVTPQNIKDWGLTNTTQKSHGLVNNGIGQPIYLEALVTKAAVVTNVTWSLTVPTGSGVTNLLASPITNGVPPYDIGDQIAYQVADRKVLVPDVVGSTLKGDYTVIVTVSVSNGPVRASTNIFFGSKYQGMYGDDVNLGCETCHYQLPTDNPKMTCVSNVALTAHASAFTRKINGEAGSGFKVTCASCHVLGYDTTAASTNNGFDDLMLQTGWTWPTNLASAAATNNWALIPSALQVKANIQCESCHGPGLRHMLGGGKTNAIGVSLSAGDCGACHDSMTHHVKNFEWGQSMHGSGDQVNRSGNTDGSCGICHSTKGFVDFRDPGYRLTDSTKTNYVRGTYNEGITCAACHDPHSTGMGAYQLRDLPSFTIATNRVITTGGDGRICMNCHHDRNDAEVKAVTGISTNSGFISVGGAPHHGVQGDMLFGTNAIQYGMTMPTSRHWEVCSNTCVTCHMQETPANMNTNALNRVGGHTFMIAYDGGGNPSNAVELTEACAPCHVGIDGFNFGGEDYDQNGRVEGVQQEITNMLVQLTWLLPPYNGLYVSNNLIFRSSTTGGAPINPANTARGISLRKAAYNYWFVWEDRSLGVHNPKYAAALLRASIDDLKGGIDVDRDGLVDSWEIKYFGSITNQNGSGDADGDGLSNAQEQAAGTNPILVDTDGDGVSDYVELTSGSDPLSALSVPAVGTNSVMILPAVELGYRPGAMGVTQQFQTITSLGLGSTWTNIGPSFVSSNSMFYNLQSLRNSTNRFYRVITP
ncbi:MAG: hypothetical protein WCO42_02585 [bacterium]